MTLTSTTTFDLIGQTQTIIFNNPSQIDQITFANNQITWGSTAGYNLSKSDLLLFLQFKNLYSNLLIANFPLVRASLNAILPVSTFQLNETFAGVTHIYFIQSSLGNPVNTFNYLPSVTSASVAARSQITISLQEFFWCVQMSNQYATQVGLN